MDEIIVIEKAGTTCEWGYGILCDSVGPRLVVLGKDGRVADTGFTDEEASRLLNLPRYWTAWDEARKAGRTP